MRAKIKKADKKQKQIQEREAKLELEKIALQKSQMKNFESVPLHLLSTNQNNLLPTNHDAQNNMETVSKSLSSSNTTSANSPQVTCNVKEEVYEDCESEKELFARFKSKHGLS